MGIITTRGLRISIPPGGLQIQFGSGPHGPTGTPAVYHVGLETFPFWLEIAYKHLLAAEEMAGRIISRPVEIPIEMGSLSFGELSFGEAKAVPFLSVIY